MNDAASAIEQDAAYMRRALALAREGWGQTAPNPMVGAVVVAGGEIVGEGYHARYGDAHAEVMALRAAGDRARGATLYVTLEPCTHHGKTPPCADAIIAAGIARVVVAVRDPSAVARGGAERLRRAGIRVDVGVEREAALRAQRAVLPSRSSRNRPWVILKLAISADGAIADPTGQHRLDHRPKRRGARCIDCAPGPTRSPSASAPCSPTTPSSPCAMRRAARRASPRGVRSTRSDCRSTRTLVRTARDSPTRRGRWATRRARTHDRSSAEHAGSASR